SCTCIWPATWSQASSARPPTRPPACADAGGATSAPLAIPLAVAALCAPVQVLVGDWNGREVARAQPTKLAALEGLDETSRQAPVHLLGWYNDGRVEYGIPVPRLLSLLAYHDPNARVAGLDA